MANLASDGGNTARAKKKKEQEALAAALRAAAQAALPVANVGMQAAGKGNLDPKFPSEVPAGNIAGSPGEGRGGDKFSLPKWSDIKGRLGLVQEKQTAPRLAPELRFNGVSGRQMAGPTLAEVGQGQRLRALEKLRQEEPFYEMGPSPKALNTAYAEHSLARGEQNKALRQARELERELRQRSAGLGGYAAVTAGQEAELQARVRRLEALGEAFDTAPSQESADAYNRYLEELQGWVDSTKKTAEGYGREAEEYNSTLGEAVKVRDKLHSAARKLDEAENGYQAGLHRAYQARGKDAGGTPAVQNDLRSLWERDQKEKYRALATAPDGLSFSEGEKEELNAKADGLWEAIDRVGRILTAHEADRDYSGTGFANETQARAALNSLKQQYEEVENQLNGYEEKRKNYRFYQEQEAKLDELEHRALADPQFAKLADKGKKPLKDGAKQPGSSLEQVNRSDVNNDVEFAIEYRDLISDPAKSLSEGLTYLYQDAGGFDPLRYTYMTDQERQVYAYYLETDPKQAQEYKEILKRRLNWQHSSEMMEQIEREARQNRLSGIAKNIGTAFTTPQAYFHTLGQQLQNTVTGNYAPVDPYTPAMRGPLIQEATQEGVTGDIEVPFWKFLADTGLSIGQNAVTLSLGPQLSLFVMSSGAAGSTASDALRRGATTEQAAALGTVAGVAEFATEKLPTEQLFKIFRGGKKPIFEALTGILRQTGTEGVEEIISEYADRVADNLIMGEKAEMEQFIRGLTSQGISREEAERRAKMEFFVKQPLLAGAGGAVSGGVMGGAATLGANLRADVRGLTLPGNEKAALQAANGLTAEGQRPSVQYSLTPYTEHQKENWANSKSIVIYEDQAQFEQFVEEAVKSKGTSGKKIYFGVVPQNLAQKVMAETGINISGLNCTLRADEVQKILNDHGSSKSESLRGQREITKQDILSIPDVLQSPDQIINGGKNEQGKPVVRFVKNSNGKTTVVSYVSDKHNDLTVKTMYAGRPDIKKGSLATTAHDSINESLASTSKTVRGTASSNSILNSAEKINYQAPRGVDALEWGRRTRKAAQAGTELERSAAFYKVDPEVTKKISRLTRDTGAKVVFDGTLEPRVEGYYSDGYIHLNPRHQNAAVRVFTHELTHHLESTGAYGKLERLVLSQQIELDRAVREKIGEYARSGKRLDEQGARAELVAEYVSERLFADEAAIRRVANADLSLAGRIRSFLSRMAAKVTGQTEKAFLLKAESLYAKAIREAERNGAATGGNRFSVENGKGLWYDGEKGGGADGAEIRDVGGRDRGEVPGAGGQGAAGDGYLRGAEENRRESAEIGDSGGSSSFRSADSEGRGEKVNGREVDYSRDWRISETVPGEQTETSLRGRGTLQSRVHTEGNTERASGENLFRTDSEGRGIKQEIAERLRGTAITDDAGNPVAVYHSTREKFTTFAKGDVGFHFGSLAQAESRARQKGGSEPSRTVRAYLNIQNPMNISVDIMSWNAMPVALKLWSDGYLSIDERQIIEQLVELGQEYDSPASVKLREILKAKGYDGIAYENGYEGAGTSYIAFYPDQIIQDSDGGDGKQFSLAKEQALLRANGDVRNALEQNRPADVRGLTLPGNEKAALQAADGLTAEGQRPAVQYSIQTAADGEKVTVLDTRQDIFEGKPQKDFAKIARREILEHFKGQVLPLGENDLARITGKTAGEYAYPHNQPKGTADAAKMRASTELDNLLQTAEYVNSANDTKNHPQANLGFDYYRTRFVVDGHVFEGLVNIATSERGRVLYDITKIEEVPDTSGKYATLVAQSTSAFGNLTGTILTQNRSNSKDMQKNSLHSLSEINYQAPRGMDAIEWGRRTRRAAQAGTELERSAAFYKVAPEVTEKISRLARDTGAKVVFDGTLEKGVNGYYGDGYLHINPHSENAPVVFSHELTHHLESTGTYEKLRNLVLTRLDEDGGLKELRRSKEAEYQRRGVNLDGAGVDAELVAEYVSERLFTDEAAIRRVANADLSLAGRIRSFLSRMAAKVTGQTEKAFLLKAESLYAKAIREAERNGAAAGGNRFSVENGKGLWYDGEKGGGADGAEIRDVGGRDRGEVPGAGGQGAAGDGYLRGAEENRRESGEIGKFNRSSPVRSVDSEGRGIKQEIAERLRGTAITDDAGNPVAVYHSTREKFTTFAKGDVGFHFGSLAQAESRARQKGGSEPSRMIRAYLNIQNPVYVSSDIMSFKPVGTALKLWSENYLSYQEYETVQQLGVQGQEYDSPASIKLREILKVKGYDGIAYENGYEGAGTSYIAFYPDQIIQDTDGGDGKQFSLGKEQALLRANGDVRNALEQNRPADVRGLTLPGNEKAALQAAEGLTAEGQRPAVQYSIQTAADGEKVTVLDTRQDIFEGKPQKDFAKIARREILEHFKGQVLPLGENDLARITGKTAGEYAYPNKTLPQREYAAKMRASTELDNLLKTAEYVSSAEDSKKHPQATLGFDYYKAIFVVDGRAFEGLLNIATSEQGRMLYDITKIEEISDSGKYATLMAQSTSTSFGDFTGNSIAQTASTDKGMQKNSVDASGKLRYAAPRGVDALEWGRRTRKAAQAGTELERSAAFYKVAPEVTEKISRLARDTGAKVVFDGTLEKGVNGYYGDGYLHINPHSENAPVVFSHELTHHLESTGTYEKLRNLVLTRLDEDGGLKELRRSKAAEYQRRGVNLDGAGVDAELVAEYVSEKLFTDEAAIRRVANADLSLAGRIRSFLSRMAAKVTGQTEKAFLLKAESLYAKAIREAERNGAAAGGNRFSVENGKGLWYDGEKGGGADGAEIRDVGGRDRGEVPGAGGQGAAGDGYLRGAEGSGEETQIGRGQSAHVRSTDSEGRGIKQEIAERLRGTAITDDARNPLAVYHSTRERFTTFAKGDVGFHFGSLAQAQDRARQKGGSEPSRTVRAYLNIQNPIHIVSDIMSWKPEGTALKLYTSGMISASEFNSVDALFGQGQEYDSPASIKLREILKAKGYDGIAYENGYEGAGTSYIAFYPDQIIQDSDGGDGKQYSLTESFGQKELEDGIKKAARMGSVADIKGIPFEPGKGLQEKVLRFIQSQGEIVNRQLGRVVFSSSRIRNDISHGIGPEKAASFAAVPEVIRQGEVVDYRKNWKGRGYDTAIIAAPITLNGTEFIEGVILTRSLGENRFYLHEVLTEKSDRVSRSTRGAANATVHTSGNTLSINSVLQKIIDVKNGRGSGVRYSLAKEQKAAGKKEVSKVRSNTFENAPTIFEKADLAAKEMAKSGFQYDVKTEQASMNEAQRRLEADYEGEVRRLPELDAWGSSDLDAAMEVLRRNPPLNWPRVGEIKGWKKAISCFE